MKRLGMLKTAMLCLACYGMILPAPVLQAGVTGTVAGQQVAKPGSAGGDVELRQGGVLLGQVVDSSGIPLAETPVSLRQINREVAATVTDKSGRFLVSGLRGGTYEIVAGQARAIYRIWAPNTGPPLARPSALVVAGGQPVRGQGPIGYWLGNPWVVAGLVAAAVTIPVVIHNHRINRTSSP